MSIFPTAAGGQSIPQIDFNFNTLQQTWRPIFSVRARTAWAAICRIGSLAQPALPGDIPHELVDRATQALLHSWELNECETATRVIADRLADCWFQGLPAAISDPATSLDACRWLLGMLECLDFLTRAQGSYLRHKGYSLPKRAQVTLQSIYDILRPSSRLNHLRGLALVQLLRLGVVDPALALQAVPPGDRLNYASTEFSKLLRAIVADGGASLALEDSSEAWVPAPEYHDQPESSQGSLNPLQNGPQASKSIMFPTRAPQIQSQAISLMVSAAQAGVRDLARLPIISKPPKAEVEYQPEASTSQSLLPEQKYEKYGVPAWSSDSDDDSEDDLDPEASDNAVETAEDRIFSFEEESSPSDDEIEPVRSRFPLKDSDGPWSEEIVLTDEQRARIKAEFALACQTDPPDSDNDPDLKDDNVDFEDDNPDLEDDNPDLKDDNLDFEDDNPDLEDNNPDLEDDNLDFEDNNPDLEDNPPDLKNDNLDLEDNDPDLEDDNPDLEDDRPDLKDDNPDTESSDDWDPRSLIPPRELPASSYSMTKAMKDSKMTSLSAAPAEINRQSPIDGQMRPSQAETDSDGSPSSTAIFLSGKSIEPSAPVSQEEDPTSENDEEDLNPPSSPSTPQDETLAAEKSNRQNPNLDTMDKLIEAAGPETVSGESDSSTEIILSEIPTELLDGISPANEEDPIQTAHDLYANDLVASTSIKTTAASVPEHEVFDLTQEGHTNRSDESTSRQVNSEPQILKEGLSSSIGPDDQASGSKATTYQPEDSDAPIPECLDQDDSKSQPSPPLQSDQVLESELNIRKRSRQSSQSDRHLDDRTQKRQRLDSIDAQPSHSLTVESITDGLSVESSLCPIDEPRDNSPHREGSSTVPTTGIHDEREDSESRAEVSEGKAWSHSSQSPIRQPVPENCQEESDGRKAPRRQPRKSIQQIAPSTRVTRSITRLSLGDSTAIGPSVSTPVKKAEPSNNLAQVTRPSPAQSDKSARRGKPSVNEQSKVGQSSGSTHRKSTSLVRQNADQQQEAYPSPITQNSEAADQPVSEAIVKPEPAVSSRTTRRGRPSNASSISKVTDKAPPARATRSKKAPARPASKTATTRPSKQGVGKSQEAPPPRATQRSKAVGQPASNDVLEPEHVVSRRTTQRGRPSKAAEKSAAAASTRPTRGGRASASAGPSEPSQPVRSSTRTKKAIQPEPVVPAPKAQRQKRRKKEILEPEEPINPPSKRSREDEAGPSTRRNLRRRK